MSDDGYPTTSGPPKDLTALISLIEQGGDFAKQFAQAVRDANENNQEAINCVESWLDPTDDELIKYGVCASRRAGLRHCTDNSLMLYAKLLEKAPEVFQ